MKTARAFLVLAALPLVVLAILATVGARDDVGVVMTGSGSHALLGAAWVVCWLGSMTLSPIAAGAALVSFVLVRTRRSLRTLRNGHVQQALVPGGGAR
ncbi:MAG: hypothetical protein QOI41_7067 [Myxococcales bacterium]|nr:hypothetical protein [Myxococcales bacterium]